MKKFFQSQRHFCNLKVAYFKTFSYICPKNQDNVMKFVRTIPGYNHLWAVKEDGKETDELSMLFRQWSNFNYLLDFFLANMEDLKGFFKIEKVSDAIKDTMEDAEDLERLILDFPYTETTGRFVPSTEPWRQPSARANSRESKKLGKETAPKLASHLCHSHRTKCVSSLAVQ